MSAPSDTIVLLVARGRAEVPRIVFRKGSPTAPVAVGTEGEWQIEAQGVADVAFYLCFDGEALHAAAASDGVSIDGITLGEAWMPVRATSEIRFGAAVVRAGGRPTIVVPRRRASDPAPAPSPIVTSPAPATSPMRARAPSEPTLCDNRLRLDALNGIPAAPPTVMLEATPLPSKPAGNPAAATNAGDKWSAATGPSERVVAAKAAAQNQPKPRRLSTVARTAIALAVVLFGANVVRFSQAAARGETIVIHSALAARSAPPEAPADPVASAAPAPTKKLAPQPTGGDVGVTPGMGSPVARTPAKAPPPNAAPPPKNERAALAAQLRDPVMPSVAARLAVNAAAAGRFAEAARGYDELARANPREASYALAAKILRDRAAHSEEE